MRFSIFLLVTVPSFFGCCFAQVSNDQSSDPLIDDIRIYQKYLSAAIGSNCNMFPSCSSYATLVFEKKPAIMGFAKTADRLLRCGNDLGHYRISENREVTHFVDLVEESTFSNEILYKYDWQDSACAYFGFICYLIDAEKYDDALLEIYRSQYQASLETKGENTYLVLLESKCYLLMNQFERALARCDSYSKLNKWDSRITELAADSYAKLKLFRAAKGYYLDIIDSTNAAENSLYVKKLIYLEASQGNWKEAENLLSNFGTEGEHVRSLLVRGENEKYKKPSLAKLCGLIPGLGYLYCNQPKTALTAFLFNGMTFFASYDLLRRGQYGMGVLMSAMSLSFYIGNIHGGGRSAKRYNSMRRERIIEPIEKWAYY